MAVKFLTFIMGVVFLSGCATANKNHTLALQQCQSQVKSLESALRSKDQEIADLEYDIKMTESGGYNKSSLSQSSKGAYHVNPSTSQVQKALKNAGYYKGAIDGKMGPKTQEAIIKFQKDNGLKADGKVGQMTWSDLKTYLD